MSQNFDFDPDSHENEKGFEQYQKLDDETYEKNLPVGTSQNQDIDVEQPIFSDKQQVTTLEEVLDKIRQYLGEDSKIENKVKGMKLLHEKIQNSKIDVSMIQPLCDWISENQLVVRYMHDDTHSHILRKIPLLLRFLYQNQKLEMSWIIEAVRTAISGHEEYVKVIQAIINFLKVHELEIVFDLVSEEKDLDSQNITTLISTICSTRELTENSPVHEKKSNNILSGLHETGREEMGKWLEPQPSFDETQLDGIYEEPQSWNFSQVNALVTKIFKFLISIIEEHQNSYIGILNKLITSKHSILYSLLSEELISLLRGNKICSLWILENCLKIQRDQEGSGKDKKKSQQSNLINKLVNDGLYEYIFAVLARNRFNRAVVEKTLNTTILLCRYYKPLEKTYTSFLWRVLGLVSRDEKEREQFFIFVKEALRFESSFTEESVNLIYFDILMKLHPDWFSFKVYECLEMLFMRLNEDLKLIFYSNQKYEILNYDLIGIDKFWYIYFYSPDLKVVKKCKQFLWRLSSYDNSQSVKKGMYEKFIDRILRFVQDPPSHNRDEIHARGFDMIDKMILDVPRKDQTQLQDIEIVIQNQTINAQPPLKKTLRLSEKTCLSILKEQIGRQINPPKTEIDLLFRGKFLKRQNNTLKELKFEKGQINTVSVTDSVNINDAEKKKAQLQQNKKTLIQFLGGEYEHGLLNFIAEKMQGEKIDIIMNELMSNNTMVEQFRIDYTRKMNEQHADDEVDSKKVEYNSQSLSNQVNDFSPDHFGVQPEEQSKQELEMQKQQMQEEQMKEEEPIARFSDMLVSEISNVQLLLGCAQSGNYVRGWQSIKKLPLDANIVKQINDRGENNEWNSLFVQGDDNDMKNVYNLHVIKHIVKKKKNTGLLEKKGGYSYLIHWLNSILDSKNYLLLESILELITTILQSKCKQLERFEQKMNKGQLSQGNLINLLTQELYELNFPNEFDDQIQPELCTKMISLLLDEERNCLQSSFPAMQMQKILLYSILKDSNGFKLCLELPHDELKVLLRLHGYSFQYLFMACLAVTKKQNLDSSTYANQLLTKLLKYMYSIEEGAFYQNQLSFYQTISSIMECCFEGVEKDIEIISQLSKTMVQYSTQLSGDQFVGMLRVLKVGLNNIYSQQPTLPPEVENSIINFAEWLFNIYLFQLENTHLHIKDKSIRKEAYQVLLILCSHREQLQKSIQNSILKIEIKQRQPDDDYIDFRKSQFIGLKNLGATCYINSLLQQIYHTKFSKLFLEKQMGEEKNIIELKKIFMRLFISNKNVVDPRAFIANTSFYGEEINTSVQQDATQFLLCLFDLLESVGYKHQIDKTFGGYLLNEITVNDELTDIKYNQEHFNSITIDIKGKKNLHEAFAYFIKPQILDGENMYYSEELNRKVRAKKRTYLEHMPNILILTLKRFEFDLQTQSRRKLNDYFQFPLELDLQKYSQSILKQKGNIITPPKEQENSKYRLVGILVHSGSAQSGHYYSYIKVGESWFQFNDKHVTQFNINQNLKTQCFGCTENRRSRSAYMLFYEKLDSDSHGVQLNELEKKGEYQEIIENQNAQFLKSRLVYDQNFMHFVERLGEQSKSSKLEKLLIMMRGKQKKQQIIPDDKENCHLINYDQKSPLLENNDIQDLIG